ncbi:MAG: SH3 domain-containing protein [Chloroflexota bacterium]
MQAVLSVIIPLLGAIGILAAVFFGLRALSARFQVGKEAYGVGQLETRRSMQKDLIWTVLTLVVGLIFLGVYVVMPEEAFEAAPEPPSAPAVTAEPSETETAPTTETAVPGTISSPTPAPFPESQVTVLPSNTPPPSATPIPTATPEPAPQTAVVASGVGVYLRAEPGVSAQDLEWLLDGTLLEILPGEAAADGYTWVLVRTPTGNEGWVATDFIQITP